MNEKDTPVLKPFLVPSANIEEKQDVQTCLDEFSEMITGRKIMFRQDGSITIDGQNLIGVLKEYCVNHPPEQAHGVSAALSL